MDNIKKVTVDQLKGKTFYNDKNNAANKVNSVKVNLNYFEGDGSELYVDTNTGLIKKIYPDGRDDVYMAFVDVDEMNFDDLDTPVEEISTEEVERKNTDQPIVPGEEAPTSSPQVEEISTDEVSTDAINNTKDKLTRDEEAEFGKAESNEVEMVEYNDERPELEEQVLVRDEQIQPTPIDTKEEVINFEAEEELPVEENTDIPVEQIQPTPEVVEEAIPQVEEETVSTENISQIQADTGALGYNSKPESGFVVTTGNRQYSMSAEDLDFFMAIVAAESDGTLDDSLGVASVILNRCEASNWVNQFGPTPIDQMKGSGQFEVYATGAYKKFLNGNAPANCQKAVLDAISGVRNNSYLGFNANFCKSYSNNLITNTGNRYR